MPEKQQGFENFLDFYNYISNPMNSELLLCPACNSKVSIRIGRSFNMCYAGQAEITCLNKECEFSKNKIYVEGSGG